MSAKPRVYYTLRQSLKLSLLIISNIIYHAHFCLAVRRSDTHLHFTGTNSTSCTTHLLHAVSLMKETKEWASVDGQTDTVFRWLLQDKTHVASSCDVICARLDDAGVRGEHSVCNAAP
jgi:hypothetical protein